MPDVQKKQQLTIPLILSQSLDVDPERLPGGDDDDFYPDVPVQAQAQGKSTNYANNAINAVLGFFGSGGVNLARNPSLSGSILPLLSGIAGWNNDTDALKNSSNAQGLASTLMSATGKGSPLAQAVVPSLIGGAADIASKGKDVTQSDILLRLGEAAAAAAGQNTKEKFAKRIDETGVLGAEKTFGKFQNKLNEMSTKSPADEVIRKSLQPPAAQEVIRTRTVPVFDRKTALPAGYNPQKVKEQLNITTQQLHEVTDGQDPKKLLQLFTEQNQQHRDNIAKYQEEILKLTGSPRLTDKKKQQIDALKATVKNLEETVADNTTRATRIRTLQGTLTGLQKKPDEVITSIPRRDAQGKPVYKTEELKSTITPTVKPPKPGSVEEDLHRFKSSEDPTLDLANDYLTNYYKATTAKDLVKQEYYSKKLHEYASTYPESTALRRALAGHMLTEANKQVLDKPLHGLWGRPGGRQVDAENLINFQQRLNTIDNRAKAAIFGSVEKADDFKNFVATVPAALQGAMERIRVDGGMTTGGSGSRFGIESLSKLLNPDALVNVYFNSEYDKNPNARKSIQLIRALASKEPTVVKALSQPGALVRTLDTIYSSIEDSGKKDEKPVDKPAEKPNKQPDKKPVKDNTTV